ncbi:MAG TPA: xanthine dehydrogenase family protein molybdopterin-binding subunit [Gemmatimonadaceae bacterium]|nr:xanthine dehydrogenase family protein molybdopterin-binding subunit [Gemmatimonadaceae bacterium]
MTSTVTRRDFLRSSAGASAGLLIALYLPSADRLTKLGNRREAVGLSPNAWLVVGTDDTVTVYLDKSEMGQGVMTALPMILADELDAAWHSVRVEQAPVTAAFIALRHGRLSTGGSTSVRTSWDPMRTAGAAAREMLVTAAAAEWGVDASSCHTESGKVVHAASGRSVTYGAVAAAAGKLAVPAQPRLKQASEFRIIGTRAKRVDTPAKTNGSAGFGIDTRQPGMLVALVKRCPVFGGKVARFDAAKAKAVPGVRHVVQISSGVAVLADGYWPAYKGRDALTVEWDLGPNATVDTAGIWKMFEDRIAQPLAVVRDTGNVAAADPDKTVDAEYRLPFLAHATMEPMNCSAHVRADGCDVWVPTQNQTGALDTAAQITGLSRDQIAVHTTFLGGGFGRRSETDFVSDAVEASKAAGAPVKVIYDRPDDIQHDGYRPAALHRLSAKLDANGWPVAWTHRFVAPSILARYGARAVDKGIDGDAISGTGDDFPYTIPNMHVEYGIAESPVPVWWWRSVGHSSTDFVIESFLDELAAAGGKDPVELRRHLLAESPRRLAVLNLAVEKSGWGTPLPNGHARGIALLDGFGNTIVVQVAEVSVEAQKVRVHRVTCAVDCGMVVNPAIVESQMESAIIYGLSAALMGEITIKDGRVEQSSFHDYPVMRMNEAPKIDVHIIESSEHPGGIGEPGLPPIAPAVANAVFALTKKRVRELPIRLV